jgi:hypothetical protein
MPTWTESFGDGFGGGVRGEPSGEDAESMDEGGGAARSGTAAIQGREEEAGGQYSGGHVAEQADANQANWRVLGG